jgi:hypothetical protein
MATVLEEYTTEEQRFVRFCGQKYPNAKDIHKEIFPIYDGKFLWLKGFLNWVANVPLMTKKLKRKLRKWLRQQSKDFYAAGFEAQVCQFWWRICRKIIVFPGSNMEGLNFIFICGLFTDSPSHIHKSRASEFQK